MTFIETLGLDYNKYSDILFYYLHLYILGGGGVQGQCKGQRLMTTFGWQHAKVKSMKSNPPLP